MIFLYLKQYDSYPQNLTFCNKLFDPIVYPKDLFANIMTLTPELITFGTYLAGQFDNQPQALAEPVWYVHLRLWLRPVNLFSSDSISFYAEQANIVKLDLPYRPRIIRLRQLQTNPTLIEIQYYMLKDIKAFQGGGSRPELLRAIAPEVLEFLPSCSLKVDIQPLSSNGYKFSAFPAPKQQCTFVYDGLTYQVYLGLEATANELQTYDKGIDPKTGSATWGALLGPYRYRKIEDFSKELRT